MSDLSSRRAVSGRWPRPFNPLKEIFMKSLFAIAVALAGVGFPAGAEAHMAEAAGGGFGADVMNL